MPVARRERVGDLVEDRVADFGLAVEERRAPQAAHRREVDREFANIFVCRFDGEGRCREFTEYYMRRRPEPPRLIETVWPSGRKMYVANNGTVNFMLNAAREETDHLAWCETRLKELGARPSVLNPLWYAGSYAIGVAAGLRGDGWNLGFVV